ncbi:hypothetical protein Q7P37_006141 [Cladosporium fusiforme]
MTALVCECIGQNSYYSGKYRKCRDARGKCDGARPSCSRCEARQLPCVYKTIFGSDTRLTTLRRGQQVHQQLLCDLRASLDMLQSTSDEGALQAFRLIRSSKDPLSTLASFSRIRQPMLTPSMHTLNPSVLPDAYLPFQYELMMRHPLAYPVPARSPMSLVDLQAMGLQHFITFPSTQLGCDPRLTDIRIDRWTPVAVQDSDAARLVSIYLQTDHPIIAPFDADLFVEDLVAGAESFCSSLLVNSVLYWACLSSSSRIPVASTLKTEFYQEAYHQWCKVSGEDNLQTVAACLILSLAHACEGDDVRSSTFTATAIEMGKRLGLFGPVAEYGAGDQLSPERRRSRAYAAWGTYSYLKQPPVGELPSCPIPDRKASASPDETFPSASYMGDTFTSLCEMWRIIQPVIELYVLGDSRRPLSERLSLDAAERTFQQLLSFADEHLSETDNGEVTKRRPHHVLVMHIWFHTAVMEIFRPFVGRNWTLKTFGTSGHTTPEIVFTASLAQLKSLALEYRQNQASASSEIDQIHPGTSISCFASTPTPTWLDLSALPTAFLRAILFMAVNYGAITHKDAEEVLRELPQNEGEPELEAEAFAYKQSGHIVDLDGAVVDQSHAQVAEMAGKLDDALLFDAFVEDG